MSQKVMIFFFFLSACYVLGTGWVLYLNFPLFLPTSTFTDEETKDRELN